LLRGPLGRRMSGDVEMHDPPSVVIQNQEHVQDLKPVRRAWLPCGRAGSVTASGVRRRQGVHVGNNAEVFGEPSLEP
jgi:hypothetical protein